jgi:hypothetical protein
MDRANDPRYNFDADPPLDEIIAQQGKGPIIDLSVLYGDLLPEEESIEDFLAALHEWRGHRLHPPDLVHDGSGTGSMGHPIQVGAGTPRMVAAVSRTTTWAYPD